MILNELKTRNSETLPLFIYGKSLQMAISRDEKRLKCSHCIQWEPNGILHSDTENCH
jgi:hypothetical protein